MKAQINNGPISCISKVLSRAITVMAHLMRWQPARPLSLRFQRPPNANLYLIILPFIIPVYNLFCTQGLFFSIFHRFLQWPRKLIYLSIHFFSKSDDNMHILINSITHTHEPIKTYTQTFMHINTMTEPIRYSLTGPHLILLKPH